MEDTTLRALRDYVIATHLDGDGDDLDADTPLLEWGVIDSIGMVDLLSFIETELGAKVGPDDVMPQHFASLRRIAELVRERRG